MADLTEMEGVIRRLDHAIEIAERNSEFDLYRKLVIIRNGSIWGPVNRGTNVARLYDRERKMKGR